MYSRSIQAPKKAFFLFGPRGTGKTTWLMRNFPEAKVIDLLPSEEAIRFEKRPSLLREIALALPKSKWIILDEIQKVPALLDEVHFLMEKHGYKKFILTGSSARKLKRGNANLLAGRALSQKMLPFNSHELNFQIDAKSALQYGLLPMSFNANSVQEKEEFLKAYVNTYLREEIKYEGLVRNVGSFARFLEVASLSAGQQINMSGLARDAEITRETVRSYFSIFEDTLLGSWLPAYRPRAKVKEVANPKFYFFDSGVLNACIGAFEQPMPKDWNGVLMEHWIHHELTSYQTYFNKKGSLGFWQTPNETEIDFLWWYGEKRIGIEVKSSKRFKPEFLKGFKSFQENKSLDASYLVYQGKEILKVGETLILPVKDFLERLYQGQIIPKIK